MVKRKECLNYIIISLTILILILISLGFNNMFGSSIDWLYQHITFPEYFRHLFYKTGNLIPSLALNIGAGQNIFNFSYYGLLSPIIMISYLLPFIKMVDYLMFAMIIVIISSSLFLYKWLRNNHFDANLALVLALLFSLSSPLIFQAHHQIMFVSYMPFLILGLLGIDLYFSKKKRWLIVLSTFLMIMTSYYYSVGGMFVFAVYTIYKLIPLKNKSLKESFLEGFKVAVAMTVGLLMAGVLILPSLYVILNGRVSPKQTIDLIALLTPKVDMYNILYSHYDLGLTAIAPLALIGGLLFKKKENRFLSIALILILIIPIFMYVLNGGLYIRGKVLIPFLPLYIFQIGIFLKHIFKNQVRFLYLLVVLLVTSTAIYFNGNTHLLYYFDLLVLLTVIGLYIWKQQKIFIYLHLVLFSLIICFIVNSQFETYVNKDYYQTISQNKISEILTQDKTFYRFNNLNYSLQTVNKIYGANYYQTNFYSSTYNANYEQFLNKIYYNVRSERNILVNTDSNNILFETLMGIKYVNTNQDAPIGYHKVKSGIYMNNNVLPLGYATNHLLHENDYLKLSHPYQLDTILYNIITTKTANAIASKIKPISLDYQEVIGANIHATELNNEYSLEVAKTDTIILKLKNPINEQILIISFDMLDIPSCKKGDTWIEINGIFNKLTCKSWLYFNKNTTFHYVLSSNQPINTIVIKFAKGSYRLGNISTSILTYRNITTAVEMVDSFIVDTKKTKGDVIAGSIKVTDDGYFATTIPYDRGYTITINNKVIKYEKVNTAFIGFPINQGEYKIIMTYKSPFLEIGKIISLIGLGLFIYITFKERQII